MLSFYLMNIHLAWYLVQHYQRVHGVKIYTTCLNETVSTNGPEPLSRNTSSLNESSGLNIDMSLLETALKDFISSNRPLSSSSNSASNQLIAAANAARSTQQQQPSQSLSSRAAGGNAAISAGANGKMNIPLSNLPSSLSTASYQSLLQEVAHRPNSFVKLLAEAARQQSCQTYGTNTINNDTISFADNQFLTPKAVDTNPARVRILSLTTDQVNNYSHPTSVLLSSRMETIPTNLYILMMAIFLKINVQNVDIQLIQCNKMNSMRNDRCQLQLNHYVVYLHHRHVQPVFHRLKKKQPCLNILVKITKPIQTLMRHLNKQFHYNQQENVINVNRLDY